MAGLAATSDPGRDRIYDRLVRRNRLVGLLRVAVPLAGVAILLFVIAAIILDNLSGQFGFASVRIDRDNLVVEAPRVTATGDDGTLYAATASSAKVRIGSTDFVDMTNAYVTMTHAGGATFTAEAPEASLQVSAQAVTIPGSVAISGDDGMHGTLNDFFGDLLNRQVVAHGPVDISLPDGKRIEAQGMSYDGNLRVWTFGRVTVTLPETPGIAP